MSDIPQIPSTTPLVIPASEEKTYPDWYVRRIEIQASPRQPNTPIRATIGGVKYNHATKEVAPESEAARKVINVDNLMDLATQRATEGKPALANAVNAVIAACAEMLNE